MRGAYRWQGVETVKHQSMLLTPEMPYCFPYEGPIDDLSHRFDLVQECFTCIVHII